MKACPSEWHEGLKRDRRVFVANTIFRGWQDDIGAAPLELRICKWCTSTVCDGTRKEDATHAA